MKDLFELSRDSASIYVAQTLGFYSAPRTPSQFPGCRLE